METKCEDTGIYFKSFFDANRFKAFEIFWGRIPFIGEKYCYYLFENYDGKFFGQLLSKWINQQW